MPTPTLETIRKNVRDAERDVARQKGLIGELDRAGEDTHEAREVLQILEESLAEYRRRLIDLSERLAAGKP